MYHINRKHSLLMIVPFPYVQAATTAEALAERPWIITMGHRPMYCSTTDDDDCDHEKSIVCRKIMHAGTYSCTYLT